MNTFEWTFELRFAVALALGFLIGLERETASTDRKLQYFAGVRTYTIISLFGFGCGWLHHINVEFALPVGLIAIGSLAVVGYLAKLKEGRIGTTSEVAALMTFVMGALVILTDVWVGMALGIITTILLSEKAGLDTFVDKLDKSEFLGVLRFLLVTVIILPVLPDRDYTQFLLNPTRIWRIVILVSTIGFVGYFLTKKLGARLGLWLSGLVGGIVSSTAVTVASARTAKRDPSQGGAALQSAILASSIMYLRILALVWLINPALVEFLWWKLVILSVVGSFLIIGIKHSTERKDKETAPDLPNPFEIRPAMLFGIFFVGLTVITSLVTKLLGNSGLLVLAGITGVMDIDPFILSLIQHADAVKTIVVPAIILAAMSNTLVKGIYFTVISKQLRSATLIRFSVWAVMHVPLVILSLS